ncbi:MAG TPA: guanylate kinase [Dongiaceae bacterium]|jgi:guanylate kinase|nr:guanylate kinase [Dongiaceae bacterium]
MDTVSIARRGLMLILSSPSGAGKTTISRRLLEREPGLQISISATTRPPRPGEQDGVDYFFMSPKDFDAMVASGSFLEHARVFNHCYGTPRKPVEAALAAGQDVLFDIDWQGTQQLAQNAREDLVSCFVLPPTKAELARRLHARAQDSSEVVALRMSKAADEISHWAEYDYIVINHHIETSTAQVHAILIAERLKRKRQTGLLRFVQGLREDGR